MKKKKYETLLKICLWDFDTSLDDLSEIINDYKNQFSNYNNLRLNIMDIGTCGDIEYVIYLEGVSNE